MNKLALACAEEGLAPLFLSQESEGTNRSLFDELSNLAANLTHTLAPHPALDPKVHAAITVIQDALRQLHFKALTSTDFFFSELGKRSPLVSSLAIKSGDAWGLIESSSLENGFQWHTYSDSEVHLHQSIPGYTNSTLWLADYIAPISATNIFIRPDPFRVRKKGSSHVRRELGAAFGKPFNRDWLRTLKGIQAAQHNPDNGGPFSEGHVSQFLWERIEKDKVQFSCEELPHFGEPDRINDQNSTRFVHGIYNTKLEQFEHFDGALHIYSLESYEHRLQIHLKDHYNEYLKAKIFLFDTPLKLEAAEKLLSLFYRWNNLIMEYFTHHETKA